MICLNHIQLQGYLGQVLSADYGYKVLGLEGVETRSHDAEKQAMKKGKFRSDPISMLLDIIKHISYICGHLMYTMHNSRTIVIYNC